MDDQQLGSVVPVAVAVVGPSRAAVLRVVEGALGWPVVGLDDLALAPVAVLADVEGAARLPADALPPLLLLGGPDDDPVAAARAGARAAVVLAGVPGPEQLRRAVAGVRTGPRGAPWVTVGAAAGGVGATTVAAALAALHVWRRGPALLAVRGPSHVPGTPDVRAADLASPAVRVAAAPVPGVDGAHAVRIRGPLLPDQQRPAVPAVVEVGGDALPDVLVVRPDRAGAAATRERPARAVVLVGRGPLPPTAVVPAVTGQRVVVLQGSARVAAAAAAGRCPADLPGTYLRPLLPLLALFDPADPVGPVVSTGRGRAGRGARVRAS